MALTIFLYEFGDTWDKKKTVKIGGDLWGKLRPRRGCSAVDGVERNISLGSVKKNYKRNLLYIDSK